MITAGEQPPVPEAAQIQLSLQGDGNADYDVGHSFVMNYVWSEAFRRLTSWGPNSLMKGWTFSGTIFEHTGFPYSIWSSNTTAALQGSFFGNTNPATTTAVLANLVGNPNINCGASAAQLINGNPNPCYSAANFADPNDNFGTQRRNQFRGPGYFDTDFGVEKSFNVPKWRLPNFQLERDSSTCSITPTLRFQTGTLTAVNSDRSLRLLASRQRSTALDWGLTRLPE